MNNVFTVKRAEKINTYSSNALVICIGNQNTATENFLAYNKNFSSFASSCGFEKKCWVTNTYVFIDLYNTYSSHRILEIDVMIMTY